MRPNETKMMRSKRPGSKVGALSHGRGTLFLVLPFLAALMLGPACSTGDAQKCSPSCDECKRCDESGNCVPDASKKGHSCGDSGSCDGSGNCMGAGDKRDKTKKSDCGKCLKPGKDGACVPDASQNTLTCGKENCAGTCNNGQCWPSKADNACDSKPCMRCDTTQGKCVPKQRGDSCGKGDCVGRCSEGNKCVAPTDNACDSKPCMRCDTTQGRCVTRTDNECAISSASFWEDGQGHILLKSGLLFRVKRENFVGYMSGTEVASVTLKIDHGADRLIGRTGSSEATHFEMPSGSIDGSPGDISFSGHSCALAKDSAPTGTAKAGSAWCWGWNKYGQVGNGKSGHYQKETSPTALSIAGGNVPKAYKQISAGGVHTCAIAKKSGGIKDGSAWCWGRIWFRQVANQDVYHLKPEPTAVKATSGNVPETYKQISAGNRHTCAIAKDGSAWCWGKNKDGQLGNGNSRPGQRETTPSAVGATAKDVPETYKQISAGGYHTCAIAKESGSIKDGSAWCWGWNNLGRLGNGETEGSNTTPTAVTTSGSPAPPETYKQISAGISHTCAIAAAGGTGSSIKEGSAWCWGYNSGGQVGNEKVGNVANVPTRVEISGKTFRAIASGDEKSCAISEDDKLYCWGKWDLMIDCIKVEYKPIKKPLEFKIEWK